jgi:hypothetical protein
MAMMILRAAGEYPGIATPVLAFFRFLDRIAKARASLRAGRGIRLEDIEPK